MERERENKYEIGVEMCWEREGLVEEVGGGYDQDTLWFARTKIPKIFFLNMSERRLYKLGLFEPF